MNFAEIQKNARENMNGNCKACRICNGEVCRGIMPGPGGKATGDGFTRSYQKLREVKVHMDTLYEEASIDTSCELFGHTFKYPFFAAPIAGVEMQYGPYLDSQRYNKMVIDACKNTGTLAFIYHHHVLTDTLIPVKESGGWAIPTVKPWPVDFMIRQFKEAEDAGCIAVCTDIDGAGLALVQGGENPVGPKSVEELRKVINSVKIPVLIKGIMTPQAALKCIDAGAYGIVISTHGGRVQDQTPAPVEMLEAIADVAKNKIKILIDGAVRTGVDIFKVIGLGADGALIGRPYPVAAYGGGQEGVEFYNQMVGAQFREAMMMTATTRVADIDKSKLFISKGF